MASRWRTGLAAALLLVAGACAPRPEPAALNPVALPPALQTTQVPILVATSRNFTGRPEYLKMAVDRSMNLNFHRFVMSIPPTHKPGAIEWPELNHVPDPAINFVVLDKADLAEEAFAQRVAQMATGGEVLVFVHGYNTSYQEAVYRFAQIVNDTGFKGAPVMFAWPSAGALVDYVRDRESVNFSRDHMERLVRRIARIPNVKKINIMAHSMGGLLTMEVLRQAKFRGDGNFGGKLNEVILASPDIDVDVFRTQILEIGKRSPPITILVSRDDRALAASKRVAGGVDRVGAFVVDDPRLIPVLEQAGLRVVDTSQISSSDTLSHNKFAASPILLKLLSKDARLGFAEERGKVTNPGLLILDGAGLILDTPRQIFGTVTGR